MGYRLVLVALAAVARLLSADVQITTRVIGISDGDTIKIIHDGIPKRIRLHGIDCPESGQPFSTKAKHLTADLAFEQVVKLIVKDTDRYGRLVAVVILADGRNLNHEIVRAGLGWWFVRYARNDATLERLESEARAAKRGLWADENPIPPWQWRKPKSAERGIAPGTEHRRVTLPRPLSPMHCRENVSPKRWAAVGRMARDDDRPDDRVESPSRFRTTEAAKSENQATRRVGVRSSAGAHTALQIREVIAQISPSASRSPLLIFKLCDRESNQ